jgi:hypothetical protein
MRTRQLICDLSTPLVAVVIAHVEWLYPLMPSYPAVELSLYGHNLVRTRDNDIKQ